MTLHIAGITHFNPLHRDRFQAWLRTKKHAGLDGPAFFATEWDSTMFAKLRDQRPLFRELLKAEWPGLSPHLLEVLTLSLAYEGDAHVSEYPNTPTVWLDEGRIPDEGDFENYLQNRLALYRSFVNGMEITDEKAFLTTMSEVSERRAATPAFVPGSRDDIFAQRILERIEGDPDQWAVAIVGKLHGSETPGSMRMQLQEHGVVCDVTYL